MNADKDEWQQLVTALGEGALQYLDSDDDGRGAAIIQLKAVLQFLHAMDQKILTTPLLNLLNALMDLQYAKPAKILEPKKTAHRQRDDMALRMVKVVSAVIMDQLQEYAELSRPDAATTVATALAKLGLSRFRGRSITATAVAKWRDQARQKNSTLSEQYEWIRAVDAKALAGGDPPGYKRAFLLHRLSVALIQYGESQEANKVRQSFAAAIQRKIAN